MCTTRRIFSALLVSALLTNTACNASYPTGATPPAVLVALEVQRPAGVTTIRVGRVFSYRAVAIDSDGVFSDVTTQATWVSAEAAVVRSVDGSSQLRAIDVGTTEIYASYRGFTAKAPVTVLPAL